MIQSMPQKVGRHISFVFTLVLMIAFDQWTKYWAVSELLNKNKTITLIKDSLSFSYVENRGAAFGLLQDARFFFIGMTVIILAVCLYYYIKLLERPFIGYPLAMLLLLSGAIGNLIDRSLQGYVVDFISFDLIRFPVFNVADIYVTFAAVYFAFLVLREDAHLAKERKQHEQHLDENSNDDGKK